jgi:putative toxin-antitoxin system antitoxin component (TIGR02293 family)
MAVVKVNPSKQSTGPNEIRPPVRFRTRASSLGLTAVSTPALIEQINAGFSFDTLRRLATNIGIDLSELALMIGIPERTLARRKASDKFAPEESERLLRISSVFEKAVDLFHGNVEDAVGWLTNPKKALGYQQPLTYARTELGAHEVENLIGRIEHGVFS